MTSTILKIKRETYSDFSEEINQILIDYQQNLVDQRDDLKIESDEDETEYSDEENDLNEEITQLEIMFQTIGIIPLPDGLEFE